MSDGALFSGQQQKNKKHYSAAGGVTRDSGEDREIHLLKCRQTKEDAGCGAGESNEGGLKVVRGEGGVSIQSGRCFRYVGTLGLLGTGKTLPSYYCGLSQRRKGK